jgi:hypothetical protein
MGKNAYLHAQQKTIVYCFPPILSPICCFGRNNLQQLLISNSLLGIAVGELEGNHVRPLFLVWKQPSTI